MKRLALISLAALTALVVAGCGNKEETAVVASTEGIYVGVDGLTYQVQLSRILNPTNVEDHWYLEGVPQGEEPKADEVWFAVFMRVENEGDGDQPLEPTGGFKITDTQGTTFEPIDIDTKLNPFAYDPHPLGPGELLPQLNSPPSDNTIQGSLILFKLTVESLGNRPLEFEIESERGGENAVVDLDV